MRIAICDDMKDDRRRISSIILDHYSVNVNIDEVETVERMFELLRKKHYDLILQDLMFDDDAEKGVSILEYINENRIDSFVIFVTSLKKYTKKTYGRNVLWLVEKSNLEKELEVGLCRFDKEIKKRSVHVFSDYVRGQEIYSDTVEYISSKGNYTSLHLLNGELAEKLSVKLNVWLEKLMDYDFIQIRNNCIVNLLYVSGVKKENVNGNRKLVIVLKSSEELSVSRGFSDFFVSSWNSYLREAARKL